MSEESLFIIHLTLPTITKIRKNSLSVLHKVLYTTKEATSVYTEATSLTERYYILIFVIVKDNLHMTNLKYDQNKPFHHGADAPLLPL